MRQRVVLCRERERGLNGNSKRAYHQGEAVAIRTPRTIWVNATQHKACERTRAASASGVHMLIEFAFSGRCKDTGTLPPVVVESKARFGTCAMWTMSTTHNKSHKRTHTHTHTTSTTIELCSNTNVLVGPGTARDQTNGEGERV